MNLRVRLLQFLAHLLTLSFIFYDIDARYLAISLAVYVLVVGFGISVGFHRLFCHRSFQCSRAVEATLLFLGSVATLGSSLAWVGSHRHHHQNSDSENDIHSPLKGALNVWFGRWPKVKIKAALVKDLINDPLHVAVHKFYLPVVIVWMLFLTLSLGLKGLVYVYCLPVVLGFHVTSAVNVLGHLSSRRSNQTGDYSSDQAWLAALSFGEGYHHSHHVNARNPRFGKWDLGFLGVRLLAKSEARRA